ncbi:bifunctional UDP-N-acetylglucosamine diphosphorylase/glucosamine-1-phosphate N-acetyltransferase GlmU [Deinococcus peraridilitoris]|uniref:Bifunctional protein GlmU n=1 Tax=Deinococcus peraridilitoris (strain DSM 19664 / LMG 22246 / CIP 109416 / KR-200) TaxID=937777 RepID=K9ZWZ3_DEIPD|nr:bifunctional UDP-N-acetylglucosamine diphosphorylase/glucosamine-1-phosphate N-acetyltransferase GlmU [Deinococcus peraridilitoris]AFZ66158.1 UDP-N-acetylglucosamine diphosphorylase/glucosamine-1-phosphate N-acetyltransferase [Deinococcus peraridilitoris DSM 19664]
MSEAPLDVVILAAGQGTRMRSRRPKVLQPVLGRPMVAWAVNIARELNARQTVVVTGHGAEEVEAALASDGLTFARQDRQLGTGHAFLAGARQLPGDGDVLVLYGDTPLLASTTVRAMLQAHRAEQSALTVLTARLPDATGYGRVVRGADGQVERIVEEKAATDEEKRLNEFNSGVYLMDRRAPQLASRIGRDNAAGEYYLTDLVALYRDEGARVSAFVIADPDEVMGANDRVQLAQAEGIMRRRVNERLMRAGVTLLDPKTTYIDDTVGIGQDTVVGPGVVIRGHSEIGPDCVIGAYSVLEDTVLAGGVCIKPHSVLEGTRVGSGSDVGPFARLRPGTVLAEQVHVGNFVEVKNATLEAGAKAGHLAYLGDAQIGREVNIGAGTITANYNGVVKSQTVIGDGAFIGSNSVLVAPVRVGTGAIVGAGSAVNKDVPEGALAVARGAQRNIEGWARRFWQGVFGQIQGRHEVLTRWLTHGDRPTRPEERGESVSE